ncbi:hypothetical protein HQN87_10150 [Paenibacillus tritici]|uniref:Uncharacterized protein n=1 Tax=Paenibacillus tritici TaxID=1873425 RepID=A0ABX2DN96_9BACL|nr:hypothetical protein [Paenibacillus tritici]
MAGRAAGITNRGLLQPRDKFPNFFENTLVYRFSYYKPLLEGEQPPETAGLAV